MPRRGFSTACHALQLMTHWARVTVTADLLLMALRWMLTHAKCQTPQWQGQAHPCRQIQATFDWPFRAATPSRCILPFAANSDPQSFGSSSSLAVFTGLRANVKEVAWKTEALDTAALESSIFKADDRKWEVCQFAGCWQLCQAAKPKCWIPAATSTCRSIGAA